MEEVEAPWEHRVGEPVLDWESEKACRRKVEVGQWLRGWGLHKGKWQPEQRPKGE